MTLVIFLVWILHFTPFENQGPGQLNDLTKTTRQVSDRDKSEYQFSSVYIP